MPQRLADLVLCHWEEDGFSELLLRAGQGGEGWCLHVREQGSWVREGKAGSWPQFPHLQNGIIMVEFSES